jgi:hypothetical protein
VGTILNDDTAPTITISDVSAAEGNAGTTPFTFTVTLSNASDQPVTVDYQTNDGTATLANNDYVAASGTLTIPAKTLSGTITVDVNGDVTNESDETFTVDLSNPTNATIADGQGVGDDPERRRGHGDAPVDVRSGVGGRRRGTALAVQRSDGSGHGLGGARQQCGGLLGQGRG